MRSSTLTDSEFQRSLKDPVVLINSLEDAILLLDRKTSLIFINKTGEELLGRSLREGVGQRLAELFPDDRVIVKLARKAIRELRSFSAKDVEIRMNGVSRVRSMTTTRSPCRCSSCTTRKPTLPRPQTIMCPLSGTR